MHRFAALVAAVVLGLAGTIYAEDDAQAIVFEFPDISPTGLSDIEQSVFSSAVSGFIVSHTSRINLGQVVRSSVERTPAGGAEVRVVLTTSTEADTAKLTAEDLNKKRDLEFEIAVGPKLFVAAVVTSIVDASLTAPATAGSTIEFIFSQIDFAAMTETELKILALGAEQQVYEVAGANVVPAYVARSDVFENPASRVNTVNGGLVDGSSGGTVVQIVLYPDTPSRVGLVSVLALADAVTAGSVVITVGSKTYLPSEIAAGEAFVSPLDSSATTINDCTDAEEAAAAAAAAVAEADTGLSKSVTAVIIAIVVIVFLFGGLMYIVRHRTHRSAEHTDEMRRLSAVLQSHGVVPGRRSVAPSAGTPGSLGPSAHFYPGGGSPAVFKPTVMGGFGGGGGGSSLPGGFGSAGGAPQKQESLGPNFGKKAEKKKAHSSIERKANAIFRKFDVDGDGSLDLEEIADMIRAIQRADPNSEVMGVSLENFEPSTLAEMMQLELDDDFDGEISRTEFVDKCTASTGLLSDLVVRANLDDVIKAARKASVPEAGPEDAALARKLSMRELAAPKAGPDNPSDKAMAVFMLFDADGNGDLSPEELAKMVRQMEKSSKAKSNKYQNMKPAKVAGALKLKPNKKGDVTQDEFARVAGQKGLLQNLIAAVELDSLYVGADKSKATDLYNMFDTDADGDLSLAEMCVMVRAMAEADPDSLTAKELSAVEPKIIAEMMQLEFDEDGDGAVTQQEFEDKCTNSPGIMAELVMHTNLAGFVNGKPVVEHMPSTEARKEADANLAAAIRRRVQDAKASSFGKDEAAASAALDADRKARQGNAAAALREQEAAAALRADAAGELALSGAASKALQQGTKTQDLFGDDPDITSDATAGKSKIWLALNPQPLAKQTAAERREQQEAVELGVLGAAGGEEVGGDSEDGMGFGSDESDFESEDDDEEADFNADDLALDPSVAAKLEANRKLRADEESARAAELQGSFETQKAEDDAKRAEEMAVIEARQKIERRASQKEEAEIVAAAKQRMATELVFDFEFFSSADKDGDGMLDIDEAKAMGMSEEIFRMIDADGNGQLTQEEFKAWMDQVQ